MPAYEYKSIYSSREPGEDRYAPADDMLNAEGAEGWQLVAVAVVPAVKVTAVYEIFYFMRTKTGPLEGTP